MNDGRISLPPSALPRVTAGDAASGVKVVSMPPNMPTDKPVKAEVVSHDKNVIVLKTEQGMVSIETRQAALANIKSGDIIQLRVQQTAQLTVQNIQNAMLVEILTVNGQTPKPVSTSPPIPPSNPDQVVLPQQNAFEAYTGLQAKLLGLPQELDNESIAMVIKTLLRLPVPDALPPALQEGFDKFLQLTGLLRQANLLPDQRLQTGQSPQHIPAGLLTALQDIVQAGHPEQNPLLKNPAQQFIQLQTVFPGEKLSPNILVDIRQQLVNILAQFNTSPLELQMQPAIPNTILAGGQLPQAGVPTPLYTMPAIGMVIGMPNIKSPLLQGNNLVFMTTPDGQHLMGLLAQNTVGKTSETPLLPGTVFVIAFQPQSDKSIAIPLIPMQLLADGMDMVQALHLTLGDTWPALDELWQNVLTNHAMQPDALAAMRQTIPAPQAQQFPPAMLFFLSVIKNGLFENWIAPEKLTGLNKLETVQQLLNDMRSMQSRVVDDGNPDSWKPLPVPMQVGDQLVRLQFFYRHPENNFSDLKDNQSSKEKHDKTRFILNIPHTHLGDLQIDGLVQLKDLEMILRTERSLSSNVEGDIRARYQAVLEATGMHGNIVFQSGREHYIRV